MSERVWWIVLLEEYDYWKRGAPEEERWVPSARIVGGDIDSAKAATESWRYLEGCRNVRGPFRWQEPSSLPTDGGKDAG